KKRLYRIASTAIPVWEAISIQSVQRRECGKGSGAAIPPRRMTATAQTPYLNSVTAAKASMRGLLLRRAYSRSTRVKALLDVGLSGTNRLSQLAVAASCSLYQ